MNNKLQNLPKIITIIFFGLLLIITSALSNDVHHINNCNEEHCPLCLIIHIAQEIVNLTYSSKNMLTLPCVVVFVTLLLNVMNNIFKINTLVKLKVQFNE